MLDKQFAVALVATCLVGPGFGCRPAPNPSDDGAVSDETDVMDARSGDDATDSTVTDPTGDVADTVDDISEPDGGDGELDDDGGDAEDGGGFGGIESADTFFDELSSLQTELACDRKWECPLDAPRVRVGGDFPSREACKNRNVRNSRTYNTLEQKPFRIDLEEGHIRFKEGAANQCLEDLRSAIEGFDVTDCSTSFDFPDPESCDVEFFTAESQQGDPCHADAACVGELRCDVPDESCGGECQPKEGTAEGETCSDALECAAGLTCAPGLDDPSMKVCAPEDSRTAGEVCSAGVCEDDLTCAPNPDNPDESVCVQENGLSAGDRCIGTAECPENHFCGLETEGASNPVCIEGGSRMAGEACDSAGAPDLKECVDGYACGPAADDGSRVCIEKGSRGEGESCSREVHCSGDLSCGIGTAGGTCKQRRVLEEGDSCLARAFVQPCKPGLTCVTDGSRSGTCQPVKTAGESCSKKGVCAGSRLHTNCLGGECTRINIPPGGSCDSGGICHDKGVGCLDDGTCSYRGPKACLEGDSG